MANRDLNRIAQEAMSRINRIPDTYRPTLNKTIHIAKFQKSFIKAQIIKELVGKKKITKEQNAEIDKLVAMYVKEAYHLVQARKSSSVYGYLILQLGSTTPVTKAGNDFRVVIYPKKSSAVPFAEASRLQKNAEKLTQVQQAAAISEQRHPERKNLSHRASSILGVEEKRLFEAGHAERTGVADVVAMEAFSVFADTSEDIHFTSTYKKTRQLVISSSVKSNRDKEFTARLIEEFPEVEQFIQIGTLIVPLEPQAVSTNKSLAVIEKRDLNRKRKELKKFLDSKSWATQESSPSKLEDTKARLMESILKMDLAKQKGKKFRKAKVGTTVSNTESKTVEKKVKEKLRVTTSNIGPKGRAKATTERPTQEPTARMNWSSLLPIINSKLPNKVIGNMKFPALQNRTGEFANSTKVVAVEQTRQGFPSFVYDYSRDPYDVFDRVKGKSPWNTPERNPSALVDRSVREIVKEMAIGRFYTRRA